MKLISSIIASLIAFAYAQNDTTTTTEDPYDMNMSSTIMFTTTTTTTEEIIFEEVTPDKDITDPITEYGCDYQFEGSLSNENIEITICGFTEEYEDDEGETITN
eukprot:CAMPEP_0201574444 /NCGR_PEP_ID=MMETSP0190_2-20130828/18933_1 /ASSEMBLY_ACC=CAM_ASM_000263 /TAXON_ID=37353 /ORGANISM="Rosalina sp." /LENGTH=103 /DNA_ID=CAMNT_0048002691 /DNA_START=1 /DNA_END=309 /DNA_ORIENTATION=+